MITLSTHEISNQYYFHNLECYVLLLKYIHRKNSISLIFIKTLNYTYINIILFIYY